VELALMLVGIVPIYNLPDVGPELRLSGDLCIRLRYENLRIAWNRWDSCFAFQEDQRPLAGLRSPQQSDSECNNSTSQG
jgi:hypothetical protein